MSVEITMTLTDVQARAVLRNGGFTSGFAARRSRALEQAEARVVDAIRTALDSGAQSGGPAT